MFKRTLILTVMTVLLLTGGLLLVSAQDDDNGDDSDACDYDTVVVQQVELQAALDTFADDFATDPDAALERLYTTGQTYQQIALDCGFLPDDLGDLFVGYNLDQVMTALVELPGDPLRGQLLYNGDEPAADGNVLGCSGCHQDEVIAPLTEGTWSRVDEISAVGTTVRGLHPRVLSG